MLVTLKKLRSVKVFLVYFTPVAGARPSIDHQGSEYPHILSARHAHAPRADSTVLKKHSENLCLADLRFSTGEFSFFYRITICIITNSTTGRKNKKRIEKGNEMESEGGISWYLSSIWKFKERYVWDVQRFVTLQNVSRRGADIRAYQKHINCGMLHSLSTK